MQKRLFASFCGSVLHKGQHREVTFFGFMLSRDKKVDYNPLTWYFLKNLCWYFCSIAGTVQIVSFDKGLKFSRLAFKVDDIR